MDSLKWKRPRYSACLARLAVVGAVLPSMVGTSVLGRQIKVSYLFVHRSVGHSAVINCSGHSGYDSHFLTAGHLLTES